MLCGESSQRQESDGRPLQGFPLLNTSRRIFACLATLLAVAAVCAGQTLSFTPIDEATVLARLHGLKRDNRQREAELKQMFESAGCTGPNLQEQPVKGAKAPNVVCTLPGKTASKIVVGAHFDHVENGMGAIDNWTGASLLTDLYQTLREAPRQHTFVFVGFTNEEKGLAGSKAYVNALSAQDKANIFAMVNFDSLGLGQTEVWGNVAAPGLERLFGELANALKMDPRVLSIPGSDADSDSFSLAGIPAITLHAIRGMDDMRLLHSVHDQVAKINAAAYYGNYRFAATYLLLLDGKASLAGGVGGAKAASEKK